MKAALRSRRTSAFTIIEVMVSSAILLLIILTIYSTWSSLLRASRIAQDAAVEVQRARMATRAVEDCLLTAQNFVENGKYYYFYTDTEDENYHFLSVASHLPPTFLGDGMFGDLSLRRVTFEVTEGEDGNKQLVMSQMPVLMMTNDISQPYSIVLVRDLTWFHLDFYDKQSGEWVKEFTATNQLPAMVRVSVAWGHQRNNPNEPLDAITRVVSIPASAVGGEIQRPDVGANPGGNNGGGGGGGNNNNNNGGGGGREGGSNRSGNNGSFGGRNNNNNGGFGGRDRGGDNRGGQNSGGRGLPSRPR